MLENPPVGEGCRGISTPEAMPDVDDAARRPTAAAGRADLAVVQGPCCGIDAQARELLWGGSVAFARLSALRSGRGAPCLPAMSGRSSAAIMDRPFDRPLRLSNGRTVITVASISEAGACSTGHRGADAARATARRSRPASGRSPEGSSQRLHGRRCWPRLRICLESQQQAVPTSNRARDDGRPISIPRGERNRASAAAPTGPRAARRHDSGHRSGGRRERLRAR